MFEEEEEPRGFGYAIQLIAGLFIGGIGSLVVIALFTVLFVGLGSRGGRTGLWIAELLNIGILGAIGYWIFRQMDRSAMSVGILIGMSIAFLLNAVCGVGILVNG